MSEKIKNLLPSKTKDLIKVLESKGYKLISQKGSHMKFSKPGFDNLIIVNSKEQSTGTLRNIAKLIFGESYYNK